MHFSKILAAIAAACALAGATSTLNAQPAYFYRGSQKIPLAAPAAALRSKPVTPSALHTRDSNSPLLPTSQIAFRTVAGVSTASLALTYKLQSIQAVPYAENTYTADVLASPGAPFAAIDVANQLQESGRAAWASPLLARQHQPRLVPNDPYFVNQWHLRNQGTNVYFGTAGNDLNTVPAWDMATGVGVNIAITDDGLDYRHLDLAPNYRPALSFDFNDNDPDPLPSSTDYHGTSCAGLSGALGNNGLGITGVAFNAGLAGLRLIAAPTVDTQEAAALDWLSNQPAASGISVNSNSWGPYDTGVNFEGPGPLTEAALEHGTTFGRGGRGIIYVWAAGNGRQNQDNINRDGYANNPNVIAVGATTSGGFLSSYSEPGACLLVNAPSNGGDGIFTTDNITTDGATSTDYTSSFGGTSAAAPEVAGVVALMLQANPDLTRRDVMHILVQTSAKNDPSSITWFTNGAGLHFSHNYGFGRVNAAAAVAAAQTWVPVPSLTHPVIANAPAEPLPTAIPDGNTTGITLNYGVNARPNFRTEHVELELNLTHPFRGQLKVNLISPSGTVSQLLVPNGDANADILNWRFRSVANWNESATGQWKVVIADRSSGYTGTVNSAVLRISGYLQGGPTSAENWQLY